MTNAEKFKEVFGIDFPRDVDMCSSSSADSDMCNSDVGVDGMSYLKEDK